MLEGQVRTVVLGEYGAGDCNDGGANASSYSWRTNGARGGAERRRDGARQGDIRTEAANRNDGEIAGDDLPARNGQNPIGGESEIRNSNGDG